MHVAEKKRLTEDGLKKIEQELENLKTVRRKEIAEKIKVALSFGDLSENSEYDEAKNEQAIIEAKITQLEAMLKVVEVVDTDELSTDIVGVGSKVRILDMDMGEEEEYQIVGSAEADPMENRISDESPMGKGLIGGRINEEIDIRSSRRHDAPEDSGNFQIKTVVRQKGTPGVPFFIVKIKKGQSCEVGSSFYAEDLKIAFSILREKANGR